MSKTIPEISRLFLPRGVAIIGASRTPGKPGSNVVQNLVNSGFGGSIYPVNPQAQSVMNLVCFPSIDAIPHPVDLAFITLPPNLIPEEIHKCGLKKVPFVSILSSGFAEEGRHDLQETLVKIARASGVRLLGPNTTGLINASNGLIGSLELIPPLRRGGVSALAQTGMFGGFLLSKIISSECYGIGKVVGLGNKCDLDESDFLEYLAQDDETKIIVCYLEGTKVKRLEEAVRRVTPIKPVIMLRSDSSSTGRLAMRYHTGSSEGSKARFSFMCKKAGAIRAWSFEDLMDLTRAFALSTTPRSNRVAIVSNTGGGFVVAADSFAQNGLRLARLTEKTLESLRKISPPWHRVTNPVDMAAIYMQSGMDMSYETAVQSVLADDNVDALVLVVGAASPPVPSKLSIFNQKVNKPILVVTMGNENYLREVKEAAKNLPIYDDVVSAVRALGELYRNALWRRKRLRKAVDYNLR